MKAFKIIGILAATAIVAGVVLNFGDLMRYIKMESM